MALTTLEEHRSFGGVQGFYEHASGTIGLPMRFGVYLPPQAKQGPVPVLFCLAGLTCNEQTFAIKAGAQQHAARHGLALVTPDTSPRGTGVAQADVDWDFGHGAGFYLDATQQPYARHWRMESWLMQELPQVLREHFPVHHHRAGILGHSMGGHGALTLALRHHPGMWHYHQISIDRVLGGPAYDGFALCAFASQQDMTERFFGDADDQAIIAADVATFSDLQRSPRRVRMLEWRFGEG